MKQGIVAQVTVYKCTDGFEFDDLDLAEQHQELVDFGEWCQNQFTGGNWSGTAIEEAIAENFYMQKKG